MRVTILPDICQMCGPVIETRVIMGSKVVHDIAISNRLIFSSLGQRSISGQPGRRFHTPPPALLQCQQGATASNTDRQPSEPSVPATEQQPRT